MNLKQEWEHWQNKRAYGDPAADGSAKGREKLPAFSIDGNYPAGRVGATRKFVVYEGSEHFPMSGHTEAIGLVDFLKLLAGPEQAMGE